MFTVMLRITRKRKRRQPKRSWQIRSQVAIRKQARSALTKSKRRFLRPTASDVERRATGNVNAQKTRTTNPTVTCK